MDERNPFISREEFLMNQIVQRNGVAPPWVENQGGKYEQLYIDNSASEASVMLISRT
jgi:Domain of unknown function (DUF1992)